MASITFMFPAFFQSVADDNILCMQVSVDTGTGHIEHDVTLRSLMIAEAHNAHDAERTARVASDLRLLANDLDALANAWTPPPLEPSADDMPPETHETPHTADDPRTLL